MRERLTQSSSLWVAQTVLLPRLKTSQTTAGLHSRRRSSTKEPDFKMSATSAVYAIIAENLEKSIVEWAYTP